MKIDEVVDSSMADKVVSIISEKANTGKIGDGKIFVSPLDKVIRIRTGETNKDAI